MNVSKKVDKPTRELENLYAPWSIMLSTTVTDIVISDPDYRCWVFFSNESNINEIQLKLSFLSRDANHINRKIVIQAEITQKGWNLVSGEYI